VARRVTIQSISFGSYDAQDSDLLETVLNGVGCSGSVKYRCIMSNGSKDLVLRVLNNAAIGDDITSLYLQGSCEGDGSFPNLENLNKLTALATYGRRLSEFVLFRVLQGVSKFNGVHLAASTRLSNVAAHALCTHAVTLKYLFLEDTYGQPETLIISAGTVVTSRNFACLPSTSILPWGGRANTDGWQSRRVAAGYKPCCC
jgi:hypothetical protein